MVQARYGASTGGCAGTKWFPGQITVSNRSEYSVKYDDGDEEHCVKERFIKAAKAGGRGAPGAAAGTGGAAPGTLRLMHSGVTTSSDEGLSDPMKTGPMCPHCTLGNRAGAKRCSVCNFRLPAVSSAVFVPVGVVCQWRQLSVEAPLSQAGQDNAEHVLESQPTSPYLRKRTLPQPNTRAGEMCECAGCSQKDDCGTRSLFARSTFLSALMLATASVWWVVGVPLLRKTTLSTVHSALPHRRMR